MKTLSIGSSLWWVWRRPKILRGFTLVELLVVIAIIGVLAGLLLPVLSNAKQKAKRIGCVNNVKQVGLSFLLYAHEYNDQLPPLNSGGPWNDPVTPHNKTNWWYQIVSNKKYLQEIDGNGGIWRCPSVLNEDIKTPFGAKVEGYGPLETKKNIPGLPSIIQYALASSGAPVGSCRLSEINRASQIWLVGEVGVPKNNKKVPDGGYTTDIVTFAPDAQGNWPHTIPKQPACRHGSKANVCFVDGHVELWNHHDLAFNKNDLYGLQSR